MKLPTLLPLCACMFAVSASAQVLMLDFGPTTAIDDVGTPNSLINSPYHTADGAFTGATWNTIGTTDVGSGGLLWSTNTVATGISINLGATTTSPNTTIGLGNTPSGSLVGTVITSGVYANTSVGKDGIFTGSSGDTRAVGMQITGLSAGTYDIYITGRNTNTSTTHVQNFYAGKSAAGDFDFSGYSTKQLSFGAGTTSATTSWSENANYVKLSVTLTSGELLNIASLGGSGEGRGFINAIQIVNTSAIPEPSTYTTVAGLICMVGVISIKRRRHAGV